VFSLSNRVSWLSLSLSLLRNLNHCLVQRLQGAEEIRDIFAFTWFASDMACTSALLQVLFCRRRVSQLFWLSQLIYSWKIEIRKVSLRLFCKLGLWFRIADTVHVNLSAEGPWLDLASFDWRWTLHFWLFGQTANIRVKPLAVLRSHVDWYPSCNLKPLTFLANKWLFNTFELS